ncbi:MAG: hypothetical protein IKN05_06805 [Clostridia bacterium]|nr:hypothetical protein [Clostridia bacterium]
MDEIMRTGPAGERAVGDAGPYKTDLPVDALRLQEFDKKLREYKAGKAKLEKRVVAAEQWWKLRNDAQARKEFDVGWDGDFRSASGWMHNVLVSKHADAMENYPEALILPREAGDKAQAKMLSAIIPCILEQTGFESTYSDAWWRKLKTGTAVYKCSWDAEALNGLGEIAIRDVDLLSVFWEPGVRDIQDSRYFFHVELQDNDLLEKQYPQLQDKLKGNTITLTKFIYDDNVSTENKSVVVDVYYKQDGVLEYCKYVGDQVLYATENEEMVNSAVKLEDAGMANPPAAGTSSDPFGATFPVSGEGMGTPQVQHRGLYDDGLYPFVFDPLFPVEGSPCGYGYVDLCKNSQVAIDILRTAFIKNTKAGATPRFFSRTEGGINEQEFLDTTKPIVHVSGPVDEQFLRSIDVSGLPGAYLNVYDSMINELRETSGNTESANGTYSAGVTAAASIAALQEASGKTSRDASRASYRAFRKLVTMIVERIRQFYDLPRQFRITGQFGQVEFVAFDNSGMVPQPVGVMGTELGYTQPVFDIRVEVQKTNAYTRTTQNELALQLYQLGCFMPGNEEPTLMLLDMMDFDGKDDLTAKLQQRMMMMQTMMAMGPAPAASEEPAKLDDGEHPGETTHVEKARERSNAAHSL